MGMSTMAAVSGFLHVSVESRMLVGSVVDGAYGAIWFNQLVVARHFVPISSLMLFLDVVGMSVFHPILERVLGVSLERNRENILISLYV
ncbi:hypothetical protein C0J52_10963 [Blattella germanica]|nr:hypothetical protein C0J52_10963 [Blattella germanica]